MQIIIKVNLGRNVETFDDLITALQATAGSLSDSTELLSEGEYGNIFDNQDHEIGYFRVERGGEAWENQAQHLKTGPDYSGPLNSVRFSLWCS